MTINELSGSEKYVETFNMCIGVSLLLIIVVSNSPSNSLISLSCLGAMNEVLMASNLEVQTFSLRPKEAKKDTARLKKEVEARKAEFERVHASEVSRECGRRPRFIKTI